MTIRHQTHIGVGMACSEVGPEPALSVPGESNEIVQCNYVLKARYKQ